MSKVDKKYMARCLLLAKNGLGTTYPNPLVGSVIVYDNIIIGEGWHQEAGKPHAEVNAIHSVKNKKLLEKSTLYVNLEPCSHYGKTPPCSDLIVKMKIPKVVIGTLDFNDTVNGEGVKHLKNNGCTVSVGVLESECLYLNRRFFTYHKKNRPYIVLKWAETQDGFIFPDSGGSSVVKKPVWISNKISLQTVHKWRTEEQAILVGTNTMVNDNPKLNVRNYFGHSPIRIGVDKSLRVSKDLHFYDNSVSTLIFSEKEVETKQENLEIIKIDFSKNITHQILFELYQKGIQSLIIEGGTKILQSFINDNLWDEARIIVGNKFFTNGIKAPSIKIYNTKHYKFKEDILTIGYND